MPATRQRSQKLLVREERETSNLTEKMQRVKCYSVGLRRGGHAGVVKQLLTGEDINPGMLDYAG